jgi:hypothetical protein
MIPSLSSLTIRIDFYNVNNRICLVAYQGHEPYGKISVNLPDLDLEPNEFFVKMYSENSPWVKHLLNQHTDLFHCQSGKGVMFNGLYFPVYKLTNKFIAEEFEKTYNPRSDIYEAPQPLWDLYAKYCEV